MKYKNFAKRGLAVTLAAVTLLGSALESMSRAYLGGDPVSIEPELTATETSVDEAVVEDILENNNPVDVSASRTVAAGVNSCYNEI